MRAEPQTLSSIAAPSGRTRAGAPQVNAPSKTARAAARQTEPLLSRRVFALRQIIPLLIVAVVVCYEATIYLIFATVSPPLLFVLESLGFGAVGAVVTWLTLNWVGREIAKRERAEGEADARSAMMQEMHHRIKNNLQTVADLLSLEMSRNPQPAVQESLRDSITRLKSISASHEMFSIENVGATNITDLARVVGETAKRNMVRPGQRIAVYVQGPPIYLASKQATAFALVLNELVSNAIEHGFRYRADGQIDIELEMERDEILLRVQDDGAGLPKEFDLTTSRGLGLHIARMLVEKDLRGKIGVKNSARRDVTDDNFAHEYAPTVTTAWVRFPASAANGE